MKSLFSRLLLSASVIVFILIVAVWQWFQFSQDFSRNQVQQPLHQELALHMAHINPLLSQGITSDAALKEAFHDFMLLAPSFEIYTLDIQGNVIAYDANQEKIKRPQVSTQPIEAFIEGGELPIKGMDPRSLDSSKRDMISCCIYHMILRPRSLRYRDISIPGYYCLPMNAAVISSKLPPIRESIYSNF
ncbi:sensor histidine kinase [Shewanella benthica KT99]|uniref:Sensor histidine kinase n=1 Tax=Shewanella benthica KT99 TaxID=314608 RepID=A9CWP2_9GAMM|nr:sensor histidine kinase [Shewanella benthica KT99]